MSKSEGSNILPNSKFLTFMTLYLVSYTPRGFPVYEMHFHRFFSSKTMGKERKNPCNRLLRLYRNKRYSQKYKTKIAKELWISLAATHSFSNIKHLLTSRSRRSYWILLHIDELKICVFFIFNVVFILRLSFSFGSFSFLELSLSFS